MLVLVCVENVANDVFYYLLPFVALTVVNDSCISGTILCFSSV